MQVKELTYPPNIEDIRKVFDIDGKPILFAYAPYIYNPMGVVIPPELFVHEGVHINRQDDKPDLWWKCYLVDKAFRFKEELLAHQAEWAYIADNYNRALRRAKLSAISERLASPLYGSLITKTKAKELISGKTRQMPRL